MGLEGTRRKWLREKFGRAWATMMKLEKGDSEPGVAVVDFMQFVKAIGNPDVRTLQSARRYFIEKVKDIMHDRSRRVPIHTCVVLVDLKPLVVKRLVEHDDRYAKKDVFSAKDGHAHLPTNPNEEIPKVWIQFAGNYKLLQRELYPRLWNDFISCRYFTPLPGQTLVLSGFPGRSLNVPVWNAQPERHGPNPTMVWRVCEWNEERDLPLTEKMEQDDPDLYHRCYRVIHEKPSPMHPQGHVYVDEWEQGKSALAEADYRMFWFDRFWPHDHIVFYCNDGDVFSVGGMYARERLLEMPAYDVGPDGTLSKRGPYHFRNRHTVCLPYKSKVLRPGDLPASREPKYDWINLNLFYEDVCEYGPFRDAGVQNPMATLVFLLILSKSDYVKKFLYDMGEDTLIWPVFFENLPQFTHLIQVTDLAGVLLEPPQRRHIIIDEHMFRLFVRYCYVAKTTHKKDGLTPRDHKVRKLSYADIKNRTKVDSKGKPQMEKRKHMPESEEIRIRCRQIEYNLSLWRNGPLGHEPDPFEEWFGLPYYPYAHDPLTGKPKIVDVVSPRQRCVDEAYAANLYRVRVLQKRLHIQP